MLKCKLRRGGVTFDAARGANPKADRMMRSRLFRYRSARSLSLTGASFLAAFLILASFAVRRVDVEMKEKRSRARALAVIHGETLRGKIDHVLSATYTLATVVRLRNGGLDDFEEVAARLIDMYPGTANLQLAPDGIVSRIAPLSGNERAIGHDLFSDPDRRAEAEATRDSRRLTIGGPYSLVQGGYGILGRYPVYLPAADGGERFWGFASVMISLPELISAARFDDLEALGYDWRFRRIPIDSGDALIVAATDAARSLPDTGWESWGIDSYGITWKIDVRPKGGWHSAGDLLLGVLQVVAMSTLLAASVWFVLMNRASGSRLDMILEAARIGTWAYDAREGIGRYSPAVAEMLGMEHGAIPPDYEGLLSMVHPDDRDRASAEMRRLLGRGRMSAVSEARLLSGTKGYVWFEIKGYAVERDRSGRLSRVFGVLIDISDHKSIEEAQSGLIAEKELILKEAHHRIKNSLSSVISLLSLQSGATDDPVTRDVLQDAAVRVESMTVLYDRLYRLESYAGFSLRSYLEYLVDAVLSHFSDGRAVDLTKDLADFEIRTQAMNTIGMIVVELLTNSMKYAFDEVERPAIRLTLERDGDRARLVVADNGRGMGRGGRGDGFGLTLIDALAAQLKAEFAYRPVDRGTEAVLTFPLQ